MRSTSTALFSLLFLLLSACAGESGDAGESEASGATSTGGSGTDTDATATGMETSTSGTGEPVGELRGVVDFTLYPPDAANDAPLLGIAGGYRMEPLGSESLFALVGLQLTLPPPPAAIDTIEEHAPLPFTWGKADTWLSAGNAIKLAHADAGEALACLYLADDAFPLYLGAASPSLAPECEPKPEVWQPSSEYRLVLYGGELFEDRIIDGKVATPAALSVSAPDLSVYDLPLDTALDLALAWEAGDDPDARIVIRVWDLYGQQTVALAADDGAFTIPAANLAAMSAGPGFLSVARERVHEVTFVAGSVEVITRYEIWGYVDLL